MILPLALVTNTLLTLTLSMLTAMATMTSMVMTMVVIMAMISPMVAMSMAMVMSMMVTISGVFLYRWGIRRGIGLCICFRFALLWDLSALMRALATDAFAVGVFDGALHMALSNDGVRKRYVVSETSTPVINEKVIFLSPKCLPDIRLLLLLFVEGDGLRKSLCQHIVQAL